MQDLPDVGRRVVYTDGGKTCSGTVVAVYPGGYKVPDEDGGYYTQPDYASIEVDDTPDWWHWSGNRFAPNIDCLEYA